MGQDIFKLPKDHPNYKQIETTGSTIKGISENIREINNNLWNFTWTLISLFVGLIISFLLSYQNNFLYWIAFSLFLISSGVILVNYLIERNQRTAKIKKLKSEREIAIGQIYFLGGIDKNKIIEYVKEKVLSKEYYQFLLTVSDQDIERNQFTSARVIFLDGQEVIYPRVQYDSGRQVLTIFNDNKNISQIIPLENRIKQIFIF